MVDPLRQLARIVSSGQAAAVAMVVGRRGSLPMAERAKMLVAADGRSEGTVGGGCLEAEIWSVARNLLSADGPARCSLDRFDLTEVEEGLGGHVCGGTVAVLTQAFWPDEATDRMLEQLVQALGTRRPAVLVSRLPAAGSQLSPAAAAVITDEGARASGAVPASVIGMAKELLGAVDAAPGEVEEGDARWFLEPLWPAPTAFILGAGHCGRAIGELAARVGFRVVVADDREAFLRADDLRWADEVVRVEFEAALARLEPGTLDHLLIVTRGHEHDLTVLRQALDTPVAYIGMIGSERKRLLFERQLRDEGFSDEAIARARSPMGLPIAADTPEEIAVAVVAEMIAVRRGAVLPEGLSSGNSSRRLARRAARRG
jgi:xanthine dehydrogenase accessory factor